MVVGEETNDVEVDKASPNTISLDDGGNGTNDEGNSHSPHDNTNEARISHSTQNGGKRQARGGDEHPRKKVKLGECCVGCEECGTTCCVDCETCCVIS